MNVVQVLVRINRDESPLVNKVCSPSVHYNRGKDGLNILVSGPTWLVEGEDDDVCSRSKLVVKEIGVQGRSCILDGLTSDGHICLSSGFSG